MSHLSLTFQKRSVCVPLGLIYRSKSKQNLPYDLQTQQECLRCVAIITIVKMSTLRQKLKLPRYGLFYFESDQTVSVVPMSKVKNVVKGDHKTIGSVVELLYGKVLLKAEIIGVDDEPNVLHKLEVEYTTDPKNAHRFTFEEDQQALLADTTSDQQGKTEKSKVQKKKQNSKKKNDQATQPEQTQNKQKNKKKCLSQDPKEKKKKEKEQATVVTRVAPAPSLHSASTAITEKDSLPPAPQCDVPSSPLQVTPRDNHLAQSPLTVPPTPPRRSPSYTDLPSSPVLSNGDRGSTWSADFSPLPTVSPRQSPYYEDLPSSSVASPEDRHSTWSLPLSSALPRERESPVFPRKLKYPTASPLYSDWSSAASPEPFSPRFQSNQVQSRLYSTPARGRQPSWSARGIQPSRSAVTQNQWYQHQSPFSPRQQGQYVQPDDSVWLITLRRLERKVDYLTQLLETPSMASQPNRYMYIPTTRQSQAQPFNTPSDMAVDNLQMGMEDNHDHLQEDTGLLKNDSLIAIRARASSSMNFAVRLLREFFLPDELKGKNVSGMRGKEQLDTTRIDKIKNFVYEFYPTPPSEREAVWRECRKAIDSYLRKTFRSS